MDFCSITWYDWIFRRLNMNHRKNRAIVLTAIVFLFISAAVLYFLTTGGKTGEARNVLVITLDTTRADRIGAYGCKDARTPNIDRLAHEGTLLEQASGAVPVTLPSHCTIFTGTSVLFHKVKSNGTYFLPGEVETLAEILKKQGFETAAFVSSFTVDSRFGLNQGFDVYDDDVETKGAGVKAYASERPAGMVVRAFSHWFEKHAQDRFFCWVHFYDPHMPYQPPEPYRTQFKDHPYDGEIAYMDENVGRVISLLESNKVLDNTLIVVAGDHGEAFGEHGEVGHQIFCYEENLRVPLIFRAGEGIPKGKRFPPRVQLMDITPTVLDYLGIENTALGAPGGRSLLPLFEGEEMGARTVYITSQFGEESLGCAPVKGIIKDNYKYLDLPRPELYYLPDDGTEKDNLFFKQNAMVRKMKQAVADLEKKYAHSSFDSKRKLSAGETRRLETLGYLVSSSSSSAGGSGQLPDPKDRINSWSDYMKGNQFAVEGKRDKAIESYKRSAAENPKFSWSFGKLAALYYEAGNAAEAEAQYRAGIAGNPGDNIIKADFANFLINEKRTDEAEEILKVLREMAPMDVGAHVDNLLAGIYMTKGEFESAISCYRDALTVEPGNRLIRTLMGFAYQKWNRLDDALSIYVELEKEDPTDFNVLFNMAMVYGMKGAYAESRAYFERVLNVNAAPVVYYNFAFVLSKAGEYAEAVEKMTKFLELYPANDTTRRAAVEFIDRLKREGSK
jgi:arylsulfatase A-like enzyme/Flp pilus assembly protein TadD